MRFLLPLLVLPACGMFYDAQPTIGGHQARFYDNRLPNAMERMFASCFDPLTLFHDDDHLGPGCGPQDFADDAAAASVLAMIEVHDAFATPLSLEFNIGPTAAQSWGLCTVTFRPFYRVHYLELYDLQAWWATPNGDPGMRVDFDFDEGWGAKINPNGTAVCANPWAQVAADQAMGKINGLRTVDFVNPDLDIDLTFANDENAWHTAMDVRVSLADVVAPNFPLLSASLLDVLWGTGMYDPETIEALIEGSLRASLDGRGVPGILVPSLAVAGPSLSRSVWWAPLLEGLKVCEVQRVSGGMSFIVDEDCAFDLIQLRGTL